MSLALCDILDTRLPLSLSLTIWAPVSSVPGSMSVFLIQPLISGNIFSASGIIIIGELVLQIAKCLFKIKEVPVIDVNKGHKYSIPINELKVLLNEVATGTQGYSFTNIATKEGGFVTPETERAPLAVGFSVYAPYSNEPFESSVFMLVPVITFPGLKGVLPILILLLLDAIFVRAVVPPRA